MTPLRRYYRGHSLVAMRDVQAAQTRYYHADHQGTTQALTDNTGAVTDRFASDAWGVQVKRTGSSINRQWYVGQLGYYRQVDQLLDYVRARYYSTPRGRWLSRDPLEDGRSPSSRYAYGDHGPVVAVDPTGLSSDFCNGTKKPYRHQITGEPMLNPLGTRCATDGLYSPRRVESCLRQVGSNPCKCKNAQVPSVDLMLCVFWMESSLGSDPKSTLYGNLGTMNEDALVYQDEHGCNPKHYRRKEPIRPPHRDFACASWCEMTKASLNYLGCVGLGGYGPPYTADQQDRIRRCAHCLDCLRGVIQADFDKEYCGCLRIVHG